MAWNIDSQPSIPTNMAHVCILIPHYGAVQLEWVNSTYAPLIFIPQPDFAKSHRVSRGIQNLDSIPGYMPVLIRNKTSGIFNVLPIEDIAIFYGKNIISGVEKVKANNIQVMYRDGSWTDVEYVLRHPFKGNLKRITTVGGTLDVTANHSVYLSTPRHREMRCNGSVDAGTIEVGNRMAMLEPYIPKSNYKRFFLGGEDLAWFYGLFAAEGSSSKYRNICGSITLSNKSLPLLEKAKSIAEHYFNDKFIILSRGGKNVPQLQVSNIRLGRILRTMFYTSSGKKKVPTEILNAPINIMNAFFDGYMAGDGYVAKNGSKEFATNSATLAMGLIFLTKMMGLGEVNIHRRQDKKDIVQVCINKGVEENIKCSRGNLKDKKMVKSIYDIDYDGYLYDFETGSHKFTAGVGLFELHNTHRNVLVKAALEDKTVTHILFLDSDVIVENPSDPNQAVRMLLACNTNLVSGLYRAKKAKGLYPYAMWAKNPAGGAGYVDIPSWTGNYISVGAVGFGFILIKREVFEHVSYPWCEWHEPPNPSEDFFACEKFTRAGYDIKVFCDVKLSHIGSMKVKIDGQVHVLDV